MHTIVLDITDSNLSYHIVLDRRINFVKGDSGSGKTTIVDLLNDSITDNTISVSCNYSYLPVRNLTWENDIKLSKHTLLIFDDMEIVSSSLFAELIKKYTIENDLCFLIMSREEFDILSNSDDLSYGEFELMTEEGVHKLRSYENRWV